MGRLKERFMGLFHKEPKNPLSNTDMFLQTAAEKIQQQNNLELVMHTSLKYDNVSLIIADPLDPNFYQIRRVGIDIIDPKTQKSTKSPGGIVKVILYPLGIIGQRRIPVTDILLTLTFLKKAEESSAKLEREALNKGQEVPTQLRPGAVGVANYIINDKCPIPSIDELAKLAGEKYIELKNADQLSIDTNY